MIPWKSYPSIGGQAGCTQWTALTQCGDFVKIFLNLQKITAWPKKGELDFAPALFGSGGFFCILFNFNTLPHIDGSAMLGASSCGLAIAFHFFSPRQSILLILSIHRKTGQPIITWFFPQLYWFSLWNQFTHFQFFISISILLRPQIISSHHQHFIVSYKPIISIEPLLNLNGITCQSFQLLSSFYHQLSVNFTAYPLESLSTWIKYYPDNYDSIDYNSLSVVTSFLLSWLTLLSTSLSLSIRKITFSIRSIALNSRSSHR